MNYKRLVLISAIGLLLLPGCNSPTELSAPKVAAQQLKPQLSEAQMRQLIESITVRVMAGEYGGGSGALIRKDGQVYTVLTNEHVVKPGKPHRIRTPDGKEYPAEIVKVREHGYDMAMLQFAAAADYEVVTLASSPGKVPQPVFAAGFPYDARDLLITKGEFSMFPSQAMLDGYQIGYTNNVRQGMSGGPVLNAEGKLIGINGMSAYPILQDAYEFADGSYPSDELRKEMNRLSWGVPIQRLAEVDPSLEMLLRPSSVASRPSLTGVAAEVNDIARQITVRIEDPEYNGSGVIIAQRGKTYYVLTADHVVMSENKYEVVTHDGKRYRVDYGKVRRLEGVDLAVLQFQSNESYRVATLANYNLSFDKRPWVFLSGWPGLNPGESRSADPEFTAGRVFSKERGSVEVKDSFSLTEANGYELVYTNPSQGGMSGGPVLDARGRVIGIHAAAEGSSLLEEGALYQIQLGYSLGVPVNTFLSLASRADVKPKWLQVEKIAPPPLARQERTAIRKALFTAKKPEKGTDATDWVNYGNKLWRLFKYEEAVAAFDEAIKMKPKLEQAWYARGLALNKQEKYQEAVGSFDKAKELNPSLYQAWRERSKALYMSKRYSEALASVDKAIEINPEDFVLYILRGIVLKELGRYAEALEASSQAIDIKPNPLAYNNSGSAHYELGNLQEALEDINKAIEINPNLSFAYNNRGLARYELGDQKGAIADYNKAIEINPDIAHAYNNRGLALYNFGELQKAIADYNKAIEINPDLALAYNNRGLARSNLGKLQEALADLNRAIEINPDLAEPYNNRGLIRSKLGELQEALADINKAIEINPDLALAYNNRGYVRFNFGDKEGGIADINKAIEINPDLALAYSNRGYTRYELGDFQGAIADFTKAIEINPNLAEAYGNRGFLYNQLGDREKGISDMHKAAQLFREQGNMARYQQTQEALRDIQQ